MELLKNPYVLVGISLTLGVTGQFLFKKGLNSMGGEIDLSWRIIFIFFTPYIASGLFAYVLSTFTYLSALSKAPLSVVYPMISCSYILVYIISVLFLKESYSLTKLLANLLIVSGVVLLYIGKK